MALFAYFCRPCDGWWDAELDADTRGRLRRYHARSQDRAGVWHHPGQAVCPSCGGPSTQHLPTEFGPTRQHRFLKREIVDSERSGVDQALGAV